MKTIMHDRFTVRPLVMALHGVFVILATQPAARAADDAAKAAAQDPAVRELISPMKSVEIGVGHVSRDAFKAGDYTGLNKQGAYPLVNFDLNGGASYDSDSARRWRITGSNLGLDSRAIYAETGDQGLYRVTFGYDELPKLRSDSYQTPFLGAGTSRLTLPAGWVAGPNVAGGTNGTTAQMSRLAASMHDFDVKSKRSKVDLGYSQFLTRQWEFRASFRDEKKEGTKILGATFGNTGGNPRAVLIPEPIDYLTKQFDTSLAFNGDKGQFQVGYYVSLFSNDVNSLAWQNPFSDSAWLPAHVGYPNFGQMGVAPDNQFHQANFSGGYNFTPTTRLTLSGSRGRMTQNESFLPYTSIASLNQATPLPRNSLDGEVVTTAFNMKLSGRPTRKLSVSAAYRYDDRDNRTPMAQYIYIGGDSANQVAPGANSDRIRTNLPRSSKIQAFNLDANYALLPGTGLKFGADHEEIERTFSEVAKTKEDTYRAEVRHTFSEAIAGSIGYAHAERKGSAYIDNGPFLASYTSAAFIASLPLAAGCATVPSCVWDNLPSQRKSYIADRKRDKVRASLNIVATEALSLQASFSSNRDDYFNSPYGLTDAKGWSASLDSSYALNESFTATAFYTYEDMKSREKGRQLGSSKANAFSAADLDWVNTITDRTDTFGLGLRHQGLLGGRLELGGDLILVRSRTPISTVVGSAITTGALPLPDLISRSDSVGFNAKYKLDKKSAIRGSYLYQHLTTSDWAFAGVGPATLANVVGTNETSPNYAVHFVGVSYIYRFD